MPTTEEDRKIKAHRELIELLNRHVKDGEESTQRLLQKFKKWENVRNDTIKLFGDSADFIKALNNGTDLLQIILKLGSAGGKIATFLGPASCAIGAGTSVACDALSALCSANKAKTLEKLYDGVLSALDEDGEITAQLFDEMNKLHRNYDKMKNCIKKFHAGTVTGFFDNVPSLQRFVNAVRRIEDVENRKGMAEFLLALRESAEEVAEDPNLFPSLVWLLTYNPEVLDLTVAIPEILVNAGILVAGRMPVGMAGHVVRGLNSLGIIADAYDIITRISNYNTYSKMAEEILKIKTELEKRKEQIKEMKKEIDSKK